MFPLVFYGIGHIHFTLILFGSLIRDGVTILFCQAAEFVVHLTPLHLGDAKFLADFFLLDPMAEVHERACPA